MAIGVSTNMALLGGSGSPSTAEKRIFVTEFTHECPSTMGYDTLSASQTAELETFLKDNGGSGLEVTLYLTPMIQSEAQPNGWAQGMYTFPMEIKLTYTDLENQSQTVSLSYSIPCGSLPEGDPTVYHRFDGSGAYYQFTLPLAGGMNSLDSVVVENHAQWSTHTYDAAKAKAIQFHVVD